MVEIVVAVHQGSHKVVEVDTLVLPRQDILQVAMEHFLELIHKVNLLLVDKVQLHDPYFLVAFQALAEGHIRIDGLDSQKVEKDKGIVVEDNQD